MAKKKKALGAAKRFGTRYGRKLREKVAFIEKEKQKSTKCPYCNYDKVKRLAVGIWNCKKCGAKFTGKAYTISKELKLEKEDSKKGERLSRKRIKAAAKRKEKEEQEEEQEQEKKKEGKKSLKEE